MSFKSQRLSNVKKHQAHTKNKKAHQKEKTHTNKKHTKNKRTHKKNEHKNIKNISFSMFLQGPRKSNLWFLDHFCLLGVSWPQDLPKIFPRGRLGPILNDFGFQLVGFYRPTGTSKSHPKCIQNSVLFFIPFQC